MNLATKDLAQALFGDTPRVRIMRLFALHPDKECSMQDILTKTHVGRMSAKAELASLVRERIVHVRPVKNVYVWKLVEGSHSTVLARLFGASLQKVENKRVDRLKKAGRVSFVAVGGKIFGDEFAPLDMVIVGALKADVLTRFLKSYEEDVGQEVQFMVLTEKDFIHRMDVRDRLLYSFFEKPHEVWLNKTKAQIPERSEGM